MAIQKQSYQIVGMKQDNLVSTGYSSKFAHEIMNMRLNTIGDYTTASWTTEKGTLPKTIEWVNCPSDALALLAEQNLETNRIIPIGQAVINDQWIVFATQTLDDDPNNRNGYDFIFKYWYQSGADNLLGTILYGGNLNFDAKHPCETLPFYENENIQKVYWVDGKNQPRVINIANNGIKYHTNLDTQFDFVQEVSLKERVDITKRTDGAGMFPPGTVKYAITYYKKYGQETNIVYTSPLYYPIKGQRGCSPDELSGDSFEIKVSNLDVNHGFDYIRLYSIVRTSDNATPIVRIVADKELASLPYLEDETSIDNPDNGYNPNNDNRYALFVDTNTTGEIVDPSILQYVGGQELVAQTFDQKNNTMFLGNIELKQKSALAALDSESLNDNQAKFVIGNYNQLRNVFDNKGYGTYHINRDYFAMDFEKAIGIRTHDNSKDDPDADNSFYQFSNQLTASNHWHSYNPDFGLTRFREHNGNSQRIKIFKYGETYRFGIQFQNIKGSWSEVIYLTDSTNNVKPRTDEWSAVGIFGIFKYTLPNAAVKKLLDSNYIKARLVCCYPNNADRTVLAQGVISNTVCNSKIAKGHAPDVMSSWFFRPNKTGHTHKTTDEIQSGLNFNLNTTVNTINSPEIEIDESIRTLDLSGVYLDTVGTIPLESYSSTYYVEATAPMTDCDGSRGKGFVKLVSTENLSTSLPKVREIGQPAGYWEDMLVYNWDHGRSDAHVRFNLYPFERNGSANDYEKDITQWVSTWGAIDDGTGQRAPIEFPVSQSAKLQTKLFSNIIYSPNTKYNDTFVSHTLKDIQIFDSNVVMPIKLNNGLIYYGNVNLIAPLNDDLYVFKWKDKNEETHAITGFYKLAEYPTKDTIEDYTLGDSRYSVSSIPIPITYNSLAHAVTLSDELLNEATPYYSLLVADIKRNASNQFGGEPSPNNIYIPCGPIVDLRECENSTTHTSPILIGLEGDHYYQRYDCLKTYSRAIDDVNQIVEILSFMIETRINLDGRYDRNRGLTDNTSIINTNFNLINKSYTQSNNFFNYTTLDKDFSKLDKFANQIAWTKDKVSGEDVDLWTNITLASTADAEGVCGAISKIINVNDSLYCFQEHGIAKIGYNEKTALSTESGIPLEIANSGKYSGLSYVSKEVGCQNKWSISNTKNGCFFIDDSRQELLALSQELTSLSTIHGIDAFLIQQLPSSEHFTPWTPLNPNNFVSYYDRLGNDVFFINKDYCLAWNEQTKTFTSFYSYNNVPLMANIGTHLLMWDINTPLTFNLNYQESTQAETVWDFVESTNTTSAIYDNPEHLVVTFNNYIAGSSYNTGISDYSLDGYLPEVSDGYTPLVIWKSNTLDSLQNSYGRWAVEPKSYNSTSTSPYNWPNHWILSLEFRKDGQPYIIQYEVEGVHKGSYPRHWEDDPLPIIKLRVTSNVSPESVEMLKNFYLGGHSQPTFNFGNVVFVDGADNQGSYYTSGGSQPWSDVDSSYRTTIDGFEREVLFVAKLYDLNGVVTNNVYNAPDPIVKWIVQGYPLRNAPQPDQAAQATSEQYEDITTTTYSWEPRTVVKTNRIYTVNSESCNTNIWAARELPEYCKFFGTVKDYWMTIVCDGITDKGSAFPADKVFNNVEFRADVFNMNYSILDNPHNNYHNTIFNKKHVWNGYQNSQEVALDGIRKFNTWRIQLPRHHGTRDRIRNPFCYIKLKQDQTVNTQTDRMILHDLAVYFDMR